MNGELPGQINFESVTKVCDQQALKRSLDEGKTNVHLSPDSELLAKPELAHQIAAEYAKGAIVFQGRYNMRNGYLSTGITESHLYLHNELDHIDLFARLHELASMADKSDLKLDKTSISLDGEVHHMQLGADNIFRCQHNSGREPSPCRLPYPYV